MGPVIDGRLTALRFHSRSVSARFFPVFFAICASLRELFFLPVIYRIAVYSISVDHAPEITVLQLPKFKAEATDLIGSDGVEALAEYLADRPDAGDVIPEAAGARKLRWAAKGKGKRGGARVIYVYVMVAARIYLLRCYAKNAKIDLTANEKKELRQIVAYLKGAH